MSPTELKAFIAEYTDAVWNEGDVEAMDRYYAPDYAHHGASRPDVRTLAGYKLWAYDLLGALSEFRVSVDDLIAEEGKAVKRWTASGVHGGALAGIPATGRRVAFSGVSVYRMAGDRIAESWYLYDLLGLLQQVGAIPAPDQVGALGHKSQVKGCGG